MTRLRKLMLDELQRRNYAQNTVRAYIHAIEDFAKYFHRSPDRLGPEHIREYQVHLFRDCKLSAGTIEGRTAALRFLFVKTLRRPYLPDHIPFPKRQRRMPTVLSQEEVARLIASARNLMHRTMLMMLYATGVRRAELCHLKVCDIDSERMVIHVRQGKGGRDRDVLLTPKLLETLREYWRWMKPKTYLFPGTVNNWRARYTHRVAISNHRLVAFQNDRVSFRWKDYARGGKQKIMAVSADEFLRRFLIHVLPKGLVRIRHFGLFANRRRGDMLSRCRNLLSAHCPSEADTTTHLRCPVCAGPMFTIERLSNSQLYFQSALTMPDSQRCSLDSS